mmetsp:Transcript_13384/g.36902  ORF Transcript_13384/g.36902 Transcript_13384/m.36902 type:complete len:271 (-) Transcript_13384:745-1557(-)
MTSASSNPGAFLTSLLGLEGKVALITGSTAGLGRAMAETLCQAGCTVVINGRNHERTQKAVQNIIDTCQVSPDKVIAAHGDTSQPEACQSIIDKLEKVDILINNAGINLTEDSFEQQYSLQEWQRISNVNMQGPMNMTHAALPLLKASTSARIINLSSMIGHVGSAKNTLYCMTKAAMLLFTKSLAADLASKDESRHITVNSVSPGAFATDMNAKFTENPEALAEIASSIPLGRLGEPQELAGMVMFLASNASSYMTGADVIVDGGYVAV